MKVFKFILLLIVFFSPVILAYLGYFDKEFAAILVALILGIFGIFHDWIRSQFNYPELDIEFNINQPDCHKTFLTRKYEVKNWTPATGIKIPGVADGEKEWHIDNVECYYYRLKIFNRGNYRAEKVEIMILEKFTENSKKRFMKDYNFLPLNLVWGHDGVVVRESIAPLLFKYCDFGCIVAPEHTHIKFPDGGVYEQGVVLDLDLAVKPNTMSHLVFPGKHRFKIIAVADNSKVVTKIFEIDFQDFWNNDEKIMLKNGLIVKEVKSLE